MSYMAFFHNLFEDASLGVKSGQTKGKVVNKNGMILDKSVDHAYTTYRFSTRAVPYFTALARRWYRNSDGRFDRNHLGRIIKRVPDDLRLTPLSVCIWYMDDGSCYPKDANAHLHTQGFTVEECEYLIERLRVDLGVNASLIMKRNQPIIYIGSRSYFDFIDLIKPHVSWDCFKYKLDVESYQKSPQLGESHSQSKLSTQQVLSIRKLYAEGLPCKEIAEKFGICSSNVTLVASGSRWKHLGLSDIRRRQTPRVSTTVRAQIVSLATRHSQQQLAEMFQLNQSTVSRIIAKANI